MQAPPPNQLPKRPARRRPFGVGWTALLALGALSSFAPRAAQAQVDVAPPLPNVMLLVDTSGSMEYRTDGSEVTCAPGNTAGSTKSRWIDLVEVLTGTIDNYSCQSVDRLSDGFKTGEYQVPVGTAPYDYKYPIPYHRPLSGTCAPGTGVFPSASNPFIYPTGGVKYHAYLDPTLSCNFSQGANDGILDAYDSAVRFGLMTFDTSLDPGMGTTAAAPGSASADLTSGAAGLWSYISSYSTTNGVKGAPVACEPTFQEVGARNAAAPPWEGRMVNFGNPANGLSAQLKKREQIEEILLATRPYGATPIAGMLQDAADFFWKDSSVDQDPEPAGATLDFGPKQDPYVLGGCRDQAILLLTDGQPNLDLRPHCEATLEEPVELCPFLLPEEVAERLVGKDATNKFAKNIPTYVVGFALDAVSVGGETKECTDLEDADCEGIPDDAHGLQACCTLRKIAIAGAPAGQDGKAYFASDRDALRAALNEILSDLVPGASRTQVVSATGGGGNFRFSSGFKPLRSTTWRGELLRQRFTCEAATDGPKVPTAEAVDPGSGDDFIHNVNKHYADRRFYTYKGTVDGGVIHSADPIRPLLTSDDGLGTYGGSSFYGDTSGFASGVGPAAMDIGSADCGSMNANTCAQHYLKWVVGLDNGTANSRCPTTGTCNVVGDILHSTPQVVNRPSALVESESYARFALLNATRPVVLYTSTNDGFLHAFKVASNDPAETSDADQVKNDSVNNELWAFAPPAVLSKFPSLYPNNHQLLLDGVPVIKDVVAVQADDGELPSAFERTDGDLLDSGGTWRTVLIQSFGSDHDGYFALDVTNPVPDDSAPSDLTKGGPRMLWQLTGSDTNHLFGRGGATPAIATLFFDPDGTGPREIAVAILPGGRGTTGTDDGSGGGCAKGGADFDAIDSGFQPRSEVRCYPSDKNIGARSLTIVRLDNGQLIRTFRQSKDEVPSAIQSKVEEVAIDSPITGQPAPFPADVGAISNRVFVGDQDGRLWKVDLSSPDPSAWTMDLFFDTFPSGTVNHAFDDGQPITTAPTLSVDEIGNLTLNVSTGDQDALGAVSDQVNYVWSLTEKLSDDRSGFETVVNWYQPFVGGERVVGPMTLFNRGLFFATYTPNDDDVCKSGSGRVWGMDYLEPNSDALSDGGLPNGLPGDVQFLTAAQLTGSDDGSIVFGVSVAQQISCYDVTASTTGTSAIGFKGEQKLSQINPGKFQLLIQTGSGKGVDGTPRVFTQDLETPTSEGFLASWASVED